MLTDRTIYTKPATPALGIANTIITDPVFGNRILRVTDANTLPSAVGASHSTTSASHQLEWRKDSAGFYVRGSAATCVPFTFNPATMQVARVAGSGDAGGLIVTTNSTEPQYSWLNSNILYVTGMDAANNFSATIQTYDVNTATYTTILNLSTIANITLQATRTYCGAVYSSESAPEKIAFFFGGTSQDLHYLAGVMEVATPAHLTVIDTLASQIYINGAAGVPTSLTLGFKLHHQQIDRTGRWCTLEPTSGDIAAGKSPKYIWDTQTNIIVPLSPYPLAHTVIGWGDFINQDFPGATPYDNAQWSYRTMSDLGNPRNVIRDPQLLGETYLDGHTSWNNALASSLQPVATELYRSQDGPNDVPKNLAPWRAWDDEIVVLQTSNIGVGTIVYRQCHHRSIVRDDIDSNSVQPFFYQPRANISPDGKWCLFTSNWDRTLGAQLNPPANQTNRYDTFLVELLYSVAVPPPPAVIHKRHGRFGR